MTCCLPLRTPCTSTQEHIRALAASPVVILTWTIQAGDFLPSHSWICPTSASSMEAARADACSIALLNPTLFTRTHAYVLLFSGGQDGRVSSSFALWDSMDRAWEDLLADQAKRCSHDRLEVEGELDHARVRHARNLADEHDRPAGILRIPVAADSDEDELGEPNECVGNDNNFWTGVITGLNLKIYLARGSM